MALHYIEFDTTQQNLLADLRTQILTSTDWSRLTPDTVLLTTTVSTTAGGTTLTFTSTASSGLAVGSIIMIDNGAVREYRAVTAITATTITVAAMSYAHNSGTEIRWGNELYKAVTTRGSEMVVDFSDAALAQDRLHMAVYRSHDGTTGVDKINRWLFWRVGGGVAAQQLHVTLSLGKEHMFIAIEGPRAGENSPTSTQYGSIKHYFFIADVIPYDPADTIPAVVAGGLIVNDGASSLANQNHLIQISRNRNNTTSWNAAKLATLDWPGTYWGATGTFNMQRIDYDGKYVLAPYVAFSDSHGMRGRLNGFFFAGHSAAENPDIGTPPANSKVQYQGQWYRLIAVSKGDGTGNRYTFGQFGGADNIGSTTYMRTPVVAVPCLP